MTRSVVVSAYPLSPAFAHWDREVEGEMLNGLAAMPGVAALEVPWIDGIHPHDSDWFLANEPEVPLTVRRCESLLTDDRVHAAVRAASDAPSLGLKVGRHPRTTPPQPKC